MYDMLVKHDDGRVECDTISGADAYAICKQAQRDDRIVVRYSDDLTRIAYPTYRIYLLLNK